MLNDNKIYLNNISSSDLDLTGYEYITNLLKKNRRKILSFLNSVYNNNVIIHIGYQYLIGVVNSINKSKDTDPSMTFDGFCLGINSFKRMKNIEIKLNETPSHALISNFSNNPIEYINNFIEIENSLLSIKKDFKTFHKANINLNIDDFVNLINYNNNIVTLDELSGIYKDIKIKDIITEKKNKLLNIESINNSICEKLYDLVNKIVICDDDNSTSIYYILSLDENNMSLYGREVSIKNYDNFFINYNQFCKIDLKLLNNNGITIIDDSFNKLTGDIITKSINILSKEFKNLSNI